MMPAIRHLRRTRGRSRSAQRLVLVVGAVSLMWAAEVRAVRVHVRAHPVVHVKPTEREGKLWLKVTAQGPDDVAVGGLPLSYAVVAKSGAVLSSDRARLSSSGSLEIPVQRAWAATKATLNVTLEKTSRYEQVQWSGPIDAEHFPTLARLHLDQAWVATDNKRLTGEVHVTRGSMAVPGAPVKLWLESQLLQRGQTNSLGVFGVDVPVSQLGQAGVKILRVRVADGRATSQRRLEVRRRLQLQLEVDPACPEQRRCFLATVSERLVDGGRRPTKGVLVQLQRGQSPLSGAQTVATTDADGRALLRLYAPRHLATLKINQVWLHASAGPGSGFDLPCVSQPVLVTLTTKMTTQAWPFMALVGALLLGGFFMMWRRRHAARATQLVLAQAQANSSKAGVSVDRWTVRGHVRDGDNGSWVTCELWLERQGVRLAAVWDESRQFRFESVPMGVWTLRGVVSGHRPLHQSVGIPHDGGLDGCILQPQSLRAHIRQRFAGAMQATARLNVQWSKDTPASVARRWMMKRRSGGAEVMAAARSTEEVLYGPNLDDAKVNAAERAIGEVHRG